MALTSSVLRKATVLAIRSLNWSSVTSISSNLGGSIPARRAEPFLAWSQATWTWRPSEKRLGASCRNRSEEHTSELQSLTNLVCRLLLEKKKTTMYTQLQIP